MPTPETDAAFATLIYARNLLSEISTELRNAVAHETGILASERVREIQGRWQAALSALEKAASEYSAALTRVQEDIDRRARGDGY